MAKKVEDYYFVFTKRDHPRRFWNKNETRYYQCLQCWWATATSTKAHGAMSGLLTSTRVSIELAAHMNLHKKKKGKK